MVTLSAITLAMIGGTILLWFFLEAGAVIFGMILLSLVVYSVVRILVQVVRSIIV